jgi:hypothetical protein
MEPTLIAFAVVPFLSSRTLLALGVLSGWYVVQASIAEGGLSVKAVLKGVACAVLAMLAEAVWRRIKGLLQAISDAYRWILRQLDLVGSVVASMAIALFVLRTSVEVARPAFTTAGVDRHGVIIGAVGVLAYLFAWLRGELTELLDFIPFVQEAAIRRTVAIGETAWTIVGLCLVFAAPIVGVVLLVSALAFTLGSVLALRRIRSGSLAPCEACQKPLHRGGSVCPHCKAARSPSRIGVVGRVRPGPPSDLAHHRLALLATRRCPSCAEQIVNDGGRIRCAGCGVPPLGDDQELRALVRYVDARALALAPAFAALGLIPVLGLGAGLVFYRASPASALSSYVGWQDRLGTRMVRGLGLTVLTLLQPVPLVGVAATLGIIALLHLWARQRVLSAAPTQTLVKAA